MISFGCTYKLVIGLGNQRKYMSFVHVYCSLWILFLLFTRTKMFGGGFQEWKDRLSTNFSFSTQSSTTPPFTIGTSKTQSSTTLETESTERAAQPQSTNLEEAVPTNLEPESTEMEAESTSRFSTQRKRVNSAYSNQNQRIGDLFDQMFSEDNVVEKIIHRIELCDEYQKQSNPEDEEERRRWTMPDSRGGKKKRFVLNLILSSLKRTSQGGFALFVIFLVIFFASLDKSGVTVLDAIAVLTWAGLEKDYSAKDLRTVYRHWMTRRVGGNKAGGGEGGGGRFGDWREEEEVEIVEMGRGKDTHRNPLHSGELTNDSLTKKDGLKKKDASGGRKGDDHDDLEKRKEEALIARSAVFMKI